MSKIETTWEQLGVTWRTGEHRAPTAERIAERVRRQSRRLRVIVVGEVILTVIVLSLALGVIVRHGTTGSLRVGALALLYTAVVWAFTLWNRRGIWQPFGETTADFVALLRVRAERRIRSAWFCLLVIGLAAILVAREVEAAWRSGSVSPWEGGVWLGFGVYSAGMILWSVWYRWCAQREIRELDGIARQIEAV